MTNLADLPKDVQQYIKSLEVRYSALEERYQLLQLAEKARAANVVERPMPRHSQLTEAEEDEIDRIATHIEP